MIYFLLWLLALVLAPRFALTLAVWAAAAPLIVVAAFNVLLIVLDFKDSLHG